MLGSYEDIQEQMRRASPRYAALTHPQPLRWEEMRQFLDDNTLLLEFAVGEKRSYLWAISRSEVRCYKLPGRAEINGISRRFYALQTSTTSETEFEAEAARLGKILLGPVAGQLAGKRLVIVPDGAIQYVPFAALSVSATTDSAQGGGTAAAYRPLMLDHEIIYLPSVLLPCSATTDIRES